MNTIRQFADQVPRLRGLEELDELLVELVLELKAKSAWLVAFDPIARLVKQVIITAPGTSDVRRQLAEPATASGCFASLEQMVESEIAHVISVSSETDRSVSVDCWRELGLRQAVIIPVAPRTLVECALVIDQLPTPTFRALLALNYLAYVIADQMPLLEERAEYRRRLSPREIEIMGLCARGLTSAEISEALKISMRTVNAHVEHAVTKLAAQNRSHAVVMLAQSGVFRTRQKATSVG